MPFCCTENEGEPENGGQATLFLSATRPPLLKEARSFAPPPHDRFAFIKDARNPTLLPSRRQTNGFRCVLGAGSRAREETRSTRQNIEVNARARRTDRLLKRCKYSGAPKSGQVLRGYFGKEQQVPRPVWV
jgi:hypothetical protein